MKHRTTLSPALLAGLFLPGIAMSDDLSAQCAQPGIAHWWSLDGNGTDRIGADHLTYFDPYATTPDPWVSAMVGSGYQPGLWTRLEDENAQDDVVLDELTFECWVRIDETTAQDSVVAVKGVHYQPLDPATEFALLLTADGRPYWTEGGQIVSSATTPAFGSFHHLAVVSGTNDITIYIDGQLDTQATRIAGLPRGGRTRPMCIGPTEPGFPFDPFPGVIDEVAVYGRPLAAAEIAAIYQCTTTTAPPEVTITAPLPDAYLAATPVTVTATVTSDSALDTVVAIVTPEGGTAGSPVPLTESPPGTWSSDQVALAERGNTIAVSATDVLGGTGGTSVDVTLDTIAPVVAIVTPTPGSVVGSPEVSFTIHVDDQTPTSLEFGGQLWDFPSGEGDATGTVNLDPGANSIAGTATDAASNATPFALPLTYDNSLPELFFDSPANGERFGPGQETITVEVRVRDDYSENTVTSTPACVSGTFDPPGGELVAPLTLTEGDNPIEVTTTDQFGRSTSVSHIVRLDTTAPTVSITSPLNGDPVSGEIELVATAADVAPGSGISRVDFQADGNPIGTDSVAPYELQYDTGALAEGSRSFVAVAFDGKGNSASSPAVTVIVDRTPPQIEILSNPYVSGAASPVDVNASDAGSGLVRVDVFAGGVPLSPVDPSATFGPPVSSATLHGEEDTTARPDGPLDLTARAIDAAGNEATTSVVVTVDNTAPQERCLLSPTDGQRVAGTIPITVETTEPNLDVIEIWVGQELLASLGASGTVPWDTTLCPDGPVVVRAIVRDLAANETICSATVTVDNTVAVEISPATLNLNLKGKGNGKVVLHLEGPRLDLLMPTEDHSIQLVVPGASPVSAEQGWAGDDTLHDSDQDLIPELNVRFARQDLVAAIKAGLNGPIQGALVEVEIRADEGRQLLDTIRIRIVGR